MLTPRLVVSCLALAFAVATPPAQAAAPTLTLACIWDTDTLAMEAKAFPGIAEVLTGRFERLPPRYYEMRLERVRREVAASPANLALYDDAGAACDRLKRSDNAVAWMERKAAVLAAADQSLPATLEHRYRLHANLGTFLAHRWLRNGAPRDNMEDIRRAESEIAEAIQINPDAHFGREKYQLAAIRWLIDLPSVEDFSPPTFVVPAPLGKGDGRVNAADAVRGISGLIVLGDAWESVDVHWALGAALRADGDSALAKLARLRIDELVSAGKQSLHPAFDPHQLLANPGLEGSRGGGLYESDITAIEAYFKRARASADALQQRRWAFMEARFVEGKHPDTHNDFWHGWREPDPPAHPWRLLPPRESQSGVLAYGAIGIALILTAYCWIRARQRRAARRPVE